MKHTYQIHGMSCNGCKTHVEEALRKVEGVRDIVVDLQKAEALIEMKSHVPLEKLQEALKKSGGNYSISLLGKDAHNHENKEQPSTQSSGVFYCPMHCEGDKCYDKPGSAWLRDGLNRATFLTKVNTIHLSYASGNYPQ